jgi:predicted MFS family arabinose efflux permease
MLFLNIWRSPTDWEYVTNVMSDQCRHRPLMCSARSSSRSCPHCGQVSRRWPLYPSTSSHRSRLRWWRYALGKRGRHRTINCRRIRSAGAERTRAVSYYAAVAGVASTVGLVVGGIFAGLLSWRLGFFINAPIGIAMMLAAPRYLPETEPRSGQTDALGAATSTVGMAALVFGIVRTADAGWSDPPALVSIAAGLALLALFVANERHARQPIMPLRLFANSERSGAYAARLLFLGAMAPFWFFTTQWLQSVAGFSAVEAGLAFMPVTVVNFAAAMAIPKLTHRYGNASVLVCGLTISVVGMAWLSRLDADTPYLPGIALPMMLIGAGQRGSLGPLTAGGIAGVTSRDAGAAGGVTNVAHQIGGSLGLAVLVAVFAAADSSGLAGEALLAHRIGAALAAGAAMLALALLIAIWVRPRRPATVKENAAQPSGATPTG